MGGVSPRKYEIVSDVSHHDEEGVITNRMFERRVITTGRQLKGQLLTEPTVCTT